MKDIQRHSNHRVLLILINLINVLTCLSALYIDKNNGSVPAVVLSSSEIINYNLSSIGEEPEESNQISQLSIPQPQSLKQTGPLSNVNSEGRLSAPEIHHVCKAEGADEDEIVCSGTVWKDELIEARSNFQHARTLVVVNLTDNGVESEGLELEDLRLTFPQATHLRFVNSSSGVKRILSTFPQQKSSWDSVKELNLSGNDVESHWIPRTFLQLFPNLRHLDLSRNLVRQLDTLSFAGELGRLHSVDISGNPLDCTKDFDWIDKRSGLKLVNPEETLCEQPPHQNKPKPILKVYPLVKEVRENCRLNCSCFVEYIWEQGKEIYSKNAVNCSHRNYIDFPDPDKMPRPTDTLYLSHNQITSLESFAGDRRYIELGLVNLFVHDNQITSINPLEGSDWLYDFQILSLRNNNLTDVPVYLLENVMRQNKRLYFIDISKNNLSCDCHTVTTLKVWLVRYGNYLRNVEDVRCVRTHEQVRHMKIEEWCQPDDEVPLVEILDLVSITLALLIVAIICKVYYDYWNYKRNGRLPWLVSKM